MHAFACIKWTDHATFTLSFSASSEPRSPENSLFTEMYFSPTFVLAALPFLISAASIDGNPRDGISIPIAKRSGSRNADGVVDIAKLQVGIQRTVALIFRIFLR